jgi:hypothetical protein
MNLPPSYDAWRLASPEEPKGLTSHQKQSLIEATIEIYQDNYDAELDDQEWVFCGLTWIECAKIACSKYDVEHEAEMIADEAKEQYDAKIVY